MRTASAPLVIFALAILLPSRGGAEEPAGNTWPRVGGHFGLALALAAFDNDGTTAIGRDFVQVGVAPGITVKLTERWAVDFEFIGFSRWDLNPPGTPDKSHTLLVVDPGVSTTSGRWRAACAWRCRSAKAYRSTSAWCRSWWCRTRSRAS